MNHFCVFSYSILGICAEGFWIIADFLHEVRWLEQHLICKINFSNLHAELKTHVLAPLRGIIKHRKQTHTDRNKIMTYV